MKKLLHWIIVAVVIVSLGVTMGLAGCKGTTAATTAAATTAAATTAEIVVETTAVETVAGEVGAFTYDPSIPVNNGEPIKILIWDNEYRRAVYETFIPEYEKLHPNVDIVWEPLGWGTEAFTKVLEVSKAGNGPDIFYHHIEWWTQIFSQIATPIPEDVLSKQTIMDNFPQYDFCVEGDGLMYSVPFNVFVHVLHYNKTLWTEAGLTEADAPKTWDQVYTLAQKLTKYDSSGAVEVAGFGVNGWAHMLAENMLYQQGVMKFNKDGSHMNIDCPEYLRAAEWIYNLYYGPNKPVDNKDNQAGQMFNSGKVVMAPMWSIMKNGFDAAAKETGFEYGAFPLPSWEDTEPPCWGPGQGEKSPAVNKYSSPEKQAVAWDFIKFILTSPSAMITVWKTLYTVPGVAYLQNNETVLAVPEAAAALPHLARTVDPGAMPSITTEGGVKYFGQILITDGVKPAEMLKLFQAEMDAAVTGPTSNAEGKYKYVDEMRFDSTTNP